MVPFNYRHKETIPYNHYFEPKLQDKKTKKD